MSRFAFLVLVLALVGCSSGDKKAQGPSPEEFCSTLMETEWAKSAARAECTDGVGTISLNPQDQPVEVAHYKVPCVEVAPEGLTPKMCYSVRGTADIRDNANIGQNLEFPAFQWGIGYKVKISETRTYRVTTSADAAPYTSRFEIVEILAKKPAKSGACFDFDFVDGAFIAFSGAAAPPDASGEGQGAQEPLLNQLAARDGMGVGCADQEICKSYSRAWGKDQSAATVSACYKLGDPKSIVIRKVGNEVVAKKDPSPDSFPTTAMGKPEKVATKAPASTGAGLPAIRAKKMSMAGAKMVPTSKKIAPKATKTAKAAKAAKPAKVGGKSGPRVPAKAPPKPPKSGKKEKSGKKSQKK